MALCAPAVGEEGAEPSVQSTFAAEGYPTPDVPECEPVGEGYFEGAVLVGDSIAAYFDLLDVMPGLTVVWKKGLSPQGAKVSHSFKVDGRYLTLTEYLESMKPSKIYLWLGSNGVHAKPSEQVLEDYEAMLNDLIPRVPDTMIYLMSLSPVRRHVEKKHPGFTNKRVDNFNEGLYELARLHNVYYLDINPLLRTKDGILDKEYGAPDGLHLRPDAYEMLAEYICTHAIPQEQEASE